MPVGTNEEERILGEVVIAEMVFLLIFTLGLVYYYRAPLVPVFVTAMVSVSFYMGFVGTFLLPADISDSVINGTSSPWVLDCWVVIYWSTFVLAWLVLPVLSSAWAEGEFTWGRRLKSAIRTNLITYVLMAIIGAGCVAFLMFKKHMDETSLSGFLMAWSNTYGLLLIILLMGHGLVEVPRRLWRSSFPQKELSLMLFRVTKVDTELYDAICLLEDAEHDVDRLDSLLGEREFRGEPAQREKLLANLAVLMATRDAFPVDVHGIKRGRSGSGGDRTAISATRKDMVKLHSRLRAAQEKTAAGRQRWEKLLPRVEVLDQVVSRTLPWPERARSDPDAGRCACAAVAAQLVLGRLRWVWRMHLAWWFHRLAFLACLFMSSLVLWCELTLGISSKRQLSPFGLVLEDLDGSHGTAHPILLQGLALVPFIYMSVCCYRSLFQLRLFGDNALQGPHQSLPGVLYYNAQSLVRLQFSLGYNFLQILDIQSRAGTAFQVLMSDMEVVPLLGKDFQTYAPVITGFLCVFTLFNGYARMLRLVGIDHEDLAGANHVEGKERLEEGRRLAERGRKQATTRDVRRVVTTPPRQGARRLETQGDGGISSNTSTPAHSPAGFVGPSVKGAAFGRLRDFDGDA